METPSNTSEDAFHEAFSRFSNLGATTFFWLSIIFIGNFLVIGNIVGTRNDQFRTVVRLLYSRFLMVDCLNNNFALTFMAIRIYWGPFSEYPCYIFSVWHELKQFGNVLFALEAVVLRLLYSVVWRNMGIINDDFMVTFFTVLNLYIAFVILGAILMLEEGYTPRYFVCLGQFSEKRPDIIPQIRRGIIVLLFFLMLIAHGIARVRDVNNTSTESKRNFVSNRFRMPDPLSVAEFAAVILILGAIPEALLRRWDTNHIWNSPNLSFTLILALFLLPFIGCVVIPLLLLIHDKYLNNGLRSILRAIQPYLKPLNSLNMKRWNEPKIFPC